MPAEIFSWALWKKYVTTRYFKMPTQFAITNFHVFKFCYSSPGLLYVKQFSNSTEVNTYSIRQRGVIVDDVQRDPGIVLSNEPLKPVVTPLTEVNSTQHRTRNGYLSHNVLNIYVTGDETVKRDFFRYGTGKD